MKNANSKPKKPNDRRTVEDARRAFSGAAEAIIAAYVFRLRFAWEAVAINLEAIEAMRRAEKSWDEIGATLGPACGLKKIGGQSVRVFRSRLKNGHYDEDLLSLGLHRVDGHIVPIDRISAGATRADEHSPRAQVNQPQHQDRVTAAAQTEDQSRQSASGQNDSSRGPAASAPPNPPEQTGSNQSEDDNSDDASPERLR